MKNQHFCVLGRLGLSWVVLGRPGCVFGVSWGVLGRLGASWGGLGRLGGVLGVPGRPKKLIEPMTNQHCCVLGRLGLSWVVSGGVLGVSWGRLGLSWGVLGASWGVLGRLGGVLGVPGRPRKQIKPMKNQHVCVLGRLGTSSNNNNNPDSPHGA